MPIIPSITNAELDAWRDPDAQIRDTEPSDPSSHFCIHHDQPATVPINAEITSRWPMIRWACRPCAEHIVSYLHGGDLGTGQRRQTIVQAAKLSAGMAKTIAEWDEPATITELRPSNREDE